MEEEKHKGKVKVNELIWIKRYAQLRLQKGDGLLDILNRWYGVHA